jgi:hypothetical protein
MAKKDGYEKSWLWKAIVQSFGRYYINGLEMRERVASDRKLHLSPKISASYYWCGQALKQGNQLEHC